MRKIVSLGFEERAIEQDDDVYSFSSDSVILANLVGAKSKDVVVDLGTGSGIIGILIALKQHAKRVIALDLDKRACALALDNIKRNGLDEVVSVVCSDVKDCVQTIGCEIADKVVCNPPYYTRLSSKGKAKCSAAFVENEATTQDFVAAASKLLRFGGEAYFVQKCERLADVTCAMRANKLEPKRLVLIFAKAGDASPDTFVMVGKKGAKVGLKTQTLYVCNSDNTMSEQCKQLYSC